MLKCWMHKVPHMKYLALLGTMIPLYTDFMKGILVLLSSKLCFYSNFRITFTCSLTN
uniref:Uncharacterized protein n=1 Tax=Rhizophora mucronata TaxID=61149 RepID=A0A2P2Q6R1_RHIMU